MEIVVNAQRLDIPLDFSMELEETNPFFEDKGSQSLPVMLPFTARNIAILDQPQRLARTNKMVAEYEAMIRSGVVQKKGRLVIFSASRAEGIQATFYMDDGELYSLLKDVHMNQLDFGAVRDPYKDKPMAEKAKEWMRHFEQVQRGEVAANYAIFPVCTNVAVDEATKLATYELLNEPDFSAADRPYRLLGYSERVIKDVRCPVGYGVTPFVRFNYVLRMLFAHFGYALQESAFDTDPALSKMVVLNNNADSICGGTLDYRQLMPACNVTTFIDAIRHKFCCEFIPDGRTKTVAVRFFETMTNTPDMDLSAYLVGEVRLVHDAFRQLRLRGGTSLPYAEPAAESFEQLMRENSYVTAMNEAQFANLGGVIQNEVILRLATGQFYKQVASGAVQLEAIGSSFFGYDKQLKKHEYDEREADDEQPPVVLIETSAAVKEDVLAPIVGERQHRNTGLKTKEPAEGEKTGECKIMFCFDLGLQGAHVAKGTPFCYNHRGEQWGTLSLQYAGQEGLFVRFWKRYERMLRHAFRKVTCELRMPLSEFMKFNMYTPKLLKGAPVLPVRVKYSIDREGLHIGEVELYTLHLLQPYDSESDQLIPPFDGLEYYWVRLDNSSALYVQSGWVEEYPVGIRPAMDPHSYPPPTADEVEAGGRYYEESYEVQIYREDHKNPANQGQTGTALYVTWLEPRIK